MIQIRVPTIRKTFMRIKLCLYGTQPFSLCGLGVNEFIMNCKKICLFYRNSCPFWKIEE